MTEFVFGRENLPLLKQQLWIYFKLKMFLIKCCHNDLLLLVIRPSANFVIWTAYRVIWYRTWGRSSTWKETLLALAFRVICIFLYKWRGKALIKTDKFLLQGYQIGQHVWVAKFVAQRYHHTISNQQKDHVSVRREKNPTHPSQIGNQTEELHHLRFRGW